MQWHMAEFSEVMKQYRRLCDSVAYCFNCPAEGFCSNLDDIEDRPHEFENIVMQWAKDNPKE